MAAPAGLCESCGRPLQWTFLGSELYVRCSQCADLFEIDGPLLAHEVREDGDGDRGLADWFSIGNA